MAQQHGRGLGIGMMGTRIPLKLLVGFLFVATTARELTAQNIRSLVTNKSISQKEDADIQYWVTNRAKDLSRGDERDLKKAEDDIIDLVTKVKPSEAFARAFAGHCSKQLGTITTQDSEDLDKRRAPAVVRILSALDRPETATTLAGALRSPHPAARFLAATGIQQLQAQLKDEADVDAVLTALGEAGATESSTLVLQEIYKAIDFKKSVRDFKFGNQMAAALARLFTGRANRLSQGARDESVDEAGLDIAASVAGDASGGNRKQLARATMALMTQAVERHIDPQTSDRTRADLIKLVTKEQELIGNLLRASAPSDSVVTLLRGAKPDEKAVRQALSKWQAAVDSMP